MSGVSKQRVLYFIEKIKEAQMLLKELLDI